MQRNERGLSGGIQFTLLFPLALSIFLLLLQWSLVTWATATAQGAAQEAAREASSYGGRQESAIDAGVAAASNGSLREVTVELSSSAEQSQATVSGVVPGVLWAHPIRQQATAPNERLTSP